MQPRTPGLTKPQKILVCLHELAGGVGKTVKYEDLVVKAFETYPDEFQLRGYPEFPDSSDIHKPLYGTLKRRGLVIAAGKTFALTEAGAAAARDLRGIGTAGVGESERERLPRDLEVEIARIKSSAAFGLYSAGRSADILDTDFLAYLGVTVRTPRNSFIGRLATVSRAVDAARRVRRDDSDTILAELHKFLLAKFDRILHQMAGE